MSEAYPRLPCFCAAWRRVDRMLMRRYDQHLRQAGMTAAQFGLLNMISAQPDVSQQQLADQLEMDKATLSRNLKGMLDLKWLMVTAGTDRRKRLLTLTPLGKQKLLAGQPLWEQSQQEIRQILGTDFAIILEKLNQLPAQLQSEN